MDDSILNSIKDMIAGGAIHEHFDNELIMCINSVIATLRQIGIGPEEGFAIDGAGISFTGCIFDGKITAGSNSGGFCATGDAQTKFTDCLFAPSSGSTTIFFTI